MLNLPACSSDYLRQTLRKGHMTLLIGALQSGGAILIHENSFEGGLLCAAEPPMPTVVTLFGCSLTNNAAKSEGGAIAVQYGTVTIQASTDVSVPTGFKKQTFQCDATQTQSQLTNIDHVPIEELC